MATTANRKAIDRILIETPRAAAADPGAPCRWLNRRELRWPLLGWFALRLELRIGSHANGRARDTTPRAA